VSAQPKLVPSFARERAADVMDEIKPLLTRHWTEIAHYPDIPLHVNYEQFLHADRNGGLRIFTIRSAGGLIGYAVFFVALNPKYMSSLQAHQYVLYLAPEHRRGRIGMRFIDWCDTQLKADGIQVVYQHVKADPKHNFGPLLERLGYTLIDQLYGRRLDHG
jgi:GNAT superfamily N-acetyltransferase